MGGLFFDPQGADFTAWVNGFKNEVYRNWIIPEVAIHGAKGHVDFEFTVERDGTISSLRMIRSCGVVELDKAAEKSLRQSRFLPLPTAFPRQRVTMQVGFFYNSGPPGSK